MKTTDMKVLVMTANIGGYDKLHDPIGKNEGVKFLAYSAEFKDGGFAYTAPYSISEKSWSFHRWGLAQNRFKREHVEHRNNILARFLKTKELAHKSEGTSYDYIMWVDANITPTVDIPTFISEIWENGNFDIVFKRHPQRNDVFSEAAACVSLSKIDEEAAAKALDLIKDKGFDPREPGLYETGMFIAKANSEAAYHLLNTWWDFMAESGVYRDQLFLPAAISANRKAFPQQKIGAITPEEFDAHFIIRKHSGGAVDLPHVQFVVPYGVDGNLGAAYNKAFEVQGEGHWDLFADEWICCMDGDILFTNSGWGKRIAAHAKNNDGCILVGSTNLLSDTAQLAGGRYNDSMDVSRHAFIEAALAEAGAVTVDLQKPPAGALFAMQRKTFELVGPFLNGLLKIDTEFFQRALEKGVPIKRMVDVYFFHYYRGGNRKSIDHLR